MSTPNGNHDLAAEVARLAEQVRRLTERVAALERTQDSRRAGGKVFH